MKKCSNCGEKNRNIAKYCMGCGEFIGAKTAMESNKLTIDILREGILLNDRFQVGELINQGGMGFIYLGKDIISNRKVAIKEMIDHFTSREEQSIAIDRFRREAEILCKLDHTAIPRFFEYFLENNRYYLIMEYVQGKDLEKVINEATKKDRLIPLKTAVGWAVEICDVLNYLHTFNPPIIYRDLKPSNIIITPREQIRLVDFGIAKIFISKVRGTMIGTQGYAPPEQYRGNAEPRSDIYSLGATLHHILSGKDPQGEAPFHFENLKKYNKKIPDALVSIVEKALRLVPSERFSTALEFKTALKEMIKNEDRFLDINQEIKCIQDEIAELRAAKSNIIQTNVVDSVINIRTEATRKKINDKKTGVTWNQYRGNSQHTGFFPMALNLKGKLRWELRIQEKIISDLVVDSFNNVYFLTESSRVLSVDKEGRIRWQSTSKGDCSASPLMDTRDRLYFGCQDGVFYALDIEGLERWRFKTGEPINFTPILTKSSIYISNSEGEVFGLDLEGHKLWQYTLGEQLNVAPSLDIDEKIYLATREKTVFVLTSNGKYEKRVDIPVIPAYSCLIYNNNIIVADKAGRVHAIKTSGENNWLYNVRSNIKAMPTLCRDGTILVATANNFVVAIDGQGKGKWKVSTQEPLTAPPVAFDDGSVFCVTNSGLTYYINAQGRIKWWFNIKDRFKISPAVSRNGLVFLASESGILYAIG
ncbi:MAG: protein kinase domain-containing protein [Vulcanimicrobiota bacterium]